MKGKFGIGSRYLRGILGYEEEIRNRNRKILRGILGNGGEIRILNLKF